MTKTIQQIIDEQREVSKIFAITDNRVRKLIQNELHSELMSGCTGPNNGRTFGPATEEAKQKNREAHLGRETTEEWAENISKAKTGVKQSKEHINALTIARNTPEAKLQRSLSLSKFTYITPLGTFESQLQMFNAYEGRPITHDRLVKWSRDGTHGFSRITKA